MRKHKTGKPVLVRIKSSATRTEGEEPCSPVDDAVDDCIQIEVEKARYYSPLEPDILEQRRRPDVLFDENSQTNSEDLRESQ